jgi:KaiC/GvpD/RAD55 family RecA-like ATPase
MTRISTGITGLDEMLGGGFLENKVVLIRGGPGTGKTILSLQFIAEGARKGQRGIYITLEEPLESIRKNAVAQNFDLEEFERKNLVRFIDGSELVFKFVNEAKRNYELQRPAVSQIANQIMLEAESFKAQRLVIDPLTSAIIHQRFPTDKRIEILELMKTLRRIKCTSIITSESASPSEDEFFVEEYLADGVIILSKTLRDFVVTKTARIEKMRGTSHDDQPRKYEISEKGIKIFASETVRA